MITYIICRNAAPNHSNEVSRFNSASDFALPVVMVHDCDIDTRGVLG